MSNSVQEKETWFPEFKTQKQYVKAKLKMLRNDMYIEPSKKEIDHLYSLTDQHDIDRAVASVIERAWS